MLAQGLARFARTEQHADRPRRARRAWPPRPTRAAPSSPRVCTSPGGRDRAAAPPAHPRHGRRPARRPATDRPRRARRRPRARRARRVDGRRPRPTPPSRPTPALARDPSRAAVAIVAQARPRQRRRLALHLPVLRDLRGGTTASRTLTVPGFQPYAAYEVAIANLAPELERRGAAESALEVLEWAGEPLAAIEVAAIRGIELDEAREELARIGDRDARSASRAGGPRASACARRRSSPAPTAPPHERPYTIAPMARSVLITGCSTGIGRATAETLAGGGLDGLRDRPPARVDRRPRGRGLPHARARRHRRGLDGGRRRARSRRRGRLDRRAGQQRRLLAERRARDGPARAAPRAVRDQRLRPDPHVPARPARHARGAAPAGS